MKKKLHIIDSILLIVAVLISCTGCFGYATRLPNNTYDKVSKILFGVDETEYVLAYRDSMDDFVVAIEKTLNSGKIDIANAFGQVKMPCDDSAVEYNKESCELWFEMLIENGKYKKLFFTLNKNDTQTIWVYATKTDSYDDGGFLEYYACDCKELIELATKYAKSITGIDGATKIEATKYDMGIEIDSVTVTEAASVKHIVDNLNSLKLKELKYNEPTAIEYELTFYNVDGEIMKTISVALGGWVEYLGSLHSVVSGELDRTYIAGLFQSKSEQNLQFEIRDRAKEENLPCDDALEKFYEDESNEYYFGAIKSHYVIVTYKDGTLEDIVTALYAGRVTIADLDKFGIEYYINPKQ